MKALLFMLTQLGVLYLESVIAYIWFEIALTQLKWIKVAYEQPSQVKMKRQLEILLKSVYWQKKDATKKSNMSSSLNPWQKDSKKKIWLRKLVTRLVTLSRKKMSKRRCRKKKERQVGNLILEYDTGKVQYDIFYEFSKYLFI